MSWRLMILAEASEDIRQAVAFYRSTAPDQVDRFIDNVQAVFTDMTQWPLASTPHPNGLRRRSVKSFPYGVWVRIVSDTQTVDIVGVIHNGRDPRLVNERTI